MRMTNVIDDEINEFQRELSKVMNNSLKELIICVNMEQSLPNNNANWRNPFCALFISYALSFSWVLKCESKSNTGHKK